MDDPNRYLPLSPHQFHILLSLSDRDRHGYALIQDIEHRTEGAFRLGTGTLYTAIARLAELGLIAEAGRPPGADAGRPSKKEDERRRYYKLLPLGRAVLRAETGRLESLVRHAHDLGVRPTVAPAVGRRS